VNEQQSNPSPEQNPIENFSVDYISKVNANQTTNQNLLNDPTFQSIINSVPQSVGYSWLADYTKSQQIEPALRYIPPATFTPIGGPRTTPIGVDASFEAGFNTNITSRVIDLVSEKIASIGDTEKIDIEKYFAAQENELKKTPAGQYIWYNQYLQGRYDGITSPKQLVATIANDIARYGWMQTLSSSEGFGSKVSAFAGNSLDAIPLVATAGASSLAAKAGAGAFLQTEAGMAAWWATGEPILQLQDPSREGKDALVALGESLALGAALYGVGRLIGFGIKKASGLLSKRAAALKLASDAGKAPDFIKTETLKIIEADGTIRTIRTKPLSEAEKASAIDVKFEVKTAEPNVVKQTVSSEQQLAIDKAAAFDRFTKNVEKLVSDLSSNADEPTSIVSDLNDLLISIDKAIKKGDGLHSDVIDKINDLVDQATSQTHLNLLDGEVSPEFVANHIKNIQNRLNDLRNLFVDDISEAISKNAKASPDLPILDRAEIVKIQKKNLAFNVEKYGLEASSKYSELTNIGDVTKSLAKDINNLDLSSSQSLQILKNIADTIDNAIVPKEGTDTASALLQKQSHVEALADILNKRIVSIEDAILNEASNTTAPSLDTSKALEGITNPLQAESLSSIKDQMQSAMKILTDNINNMIKRAKISFKFNNLADSLAVFFDDNIAKFDFDKPDISLQKLLDASKEFGLDIVIADIDSAPKGSPAHEIYLRRTEAAVKSLKAEVNRFIGRVTDAAQTNLDAAGVVRAKASTASAVGSGEYSIIEAAPEKSIAKQSSILEEQKDLLQKTLQEATRNAADVSKLKEQTATMAENLSKVARSIKSTPLKIGAYVTGGILGINLLAYYRAFKRIKELIAKLQRAATSPTAENAASMLVNRDDYVTEYGQSASWLENRETFIMFQSVLSSVKQTTEVKELIDSINIKTFGAQERAEWNAKAFDLLQNMQRKQQVENLNLQVSSELVVNSAANAYSNLLPDLSRVASTVSVLSKNNPEIAKNVKSITNAINNALQLRMALEFRSFDASIKGFINDIAEELSTSSTRQSILLWSKISNQVFSNLTGISDASVSGLNGRGQDYLANISILVIGNALKDVLEDASDGNIDEKKLNPKWMENIVKTSGATNVINDNLIARANNAVSDTNNRNLGFYMPTDPKDILMYIGLQAELKAKAGNYSAREYDALWRVLPVSDMLAMGRIDYLLNKDKRSYVDYYDTIGKYLNDAKFNQIEKARQKNVIRNKESIDSSGVLKQITPITPKSLIKEIK